MLIKFVSMSRTMTHIILQNSGWPYGHTRPAVGPPCGRVATSSQEHLQSIRIHLGVAHWRQSPVCRMMGTPMFQFIPPVPTSMAPRKAAVAHRDSWCKLDKESADPVTQLIHSRGSENLHISGLFVMHASTLLRMHPCTGSHLSGCLNPRGELLSGTHDI